MSRDSGFIRAYGPPVGLALLVAAGFWMMGQDGDSPAGGALERQPEWQFGGSVSAVAVDGSFAWLGTGNRIQAVDLSNPPLPQPRGQSEALPEAVRAVVADGETVFAAAGLSGLAIFDVTDPDQIQLIETIETAWATNDIVVEEGLAYLADGSLGLRIFDVSRPDDPQELGSHDTPGDALALTLDRRALVSDSAGGSSHDEASGGGSSIGGSDERLIAYIADWGTGVRIVDVTDPAKAEEIAWIDTPGIASDVAAAGDLLLIADREEGLRVVDVSDLENPRDRASLALPGTVERVLLDGDQAYVAAHDGGGLLVDLSDPDAPLLKGRLEDATVVVDLAQNEGSVYFADVGTNVAPAVDSRADLWARMHIWGVEGSPKVAAGVAGMHIAAPRDEGFEKVGMYFSPSLIEGSDVLEEAQIMYMADGLAGVLVVDVEDRAAPKIIGSIDIPGSSHNLRIEGDRVFVAGGEAGLVMLDISDPRNPEAVDQVDTPGDAMGLALADGLVFVADGPGGLRVIDPGSGADEPMAEIGFFDTPGNSWNVDVSDGVAYISDRPGGLRIYDVSQPTAPQEIAVHYEGQADILDVLVEEDRLWVAGGLSGVRYMDIADPSQPEELGLVVLEDRAIGVVKEADRIFVAAGTAGLRELKANSSGIPEEIAGWAMPGSAERMLRYEDRLYVAAEMGGLQVVPLKP